MSTHSNSTEAHNFYYLGVDNGEEHSYAKCSLHYRKNTAVSYATAVAKVIPAKSYSPERVNTANPDSGITLLSMFSMSSTTGRHIGDLAHASPFQVIRVPLVFGNRDITPNSVRDELLEQMRYHVKRLNTRNDRGRFVELIEARKAILRDACEEWAKPMLDKRFKEFTSVDITKQAAEIAAGNRKKAAKQAAETRAVFARYVKDRKGSDYCEFVRALYDTHYTSAKYPLTDTERLLIKRRLGNTNKAYVWVDGDEVVTSKGIRIPIQEARVAMKMWASGIDMRSRFISRYVITKYQGDEICIGCHHIPRENMLALYEAVIGKPFPENVKGKEVA